MNFPCSVYKTKQKLIVRVQDRLHSVNILRDRKRRVGVHVTLFGVVCHCLVAMCIGAGMCGLKGKITSWVMAYHEEKA